LNKEQKTPNAPTRLSGSVRFVPVGHAKRVVIWRKFGVSKMELLLRERLVHPYWRWTMLVERGLRVMNAGVVGEAYAIAANYLHRSGALADDFVTNDRLLAIIIQLFERGEFNKLRLANKAIAQFETDELV
jgi:hypothetical protein